MLGQQYLNQPTSKASFTAGVPNPWAVARYQALSLLEPGRESDGQAEMHPHSHEQQASLRVCQLLVWNHPLPLPLSAKSKKLGTEI